MKETISYVPLQTIFDECGVPLKGITWDNLSTIGENNITICINIIMEKTKNVIKVLQERFISSTDTNPIIRAENEIYHKGISYFISEFDKNRKNWMHKMVDAENGIKKPTLPNLRPFVKYRKYDHFVTFPYNYYKRGNTSVSFEWFSLLLNYGGSENYAFVPCPRIIATPSDVSYEGYYWRLYSKSSMFMLYKEYNWILENKKDSEFIKLWFENSTDREGPKSFEDFNKILDVPSRITPDCTMDMIKESSKKEVLEQTTKLYLSEFFNEQ